MSNRVYWLLNVKPEEYTLVKKLFLVQFFLGIATAFLFTSSLTLFLSAYKISQLPRVYLLAAALLGGCNVLYTRFEARFTPVKLLQGITLLALLSILILWLGFIFKTHSGLPFFLMAWHLVVYMTISYAFWGLTAMQFNVRESKRLFSVVGSGDIPAKMLGYFAVTALVPFVNVIHLLWISLLCLGVAYAYLRKFPVPDGNQHDSPTSSVSHSLPEPSSGRPQSGWWEQYFISPFITSIALWSLLAYIIFALIDFTFLAEIKLKYTSQHQLATFISMFFAVGRLLAILIKLLFSSKLIARFGLSNVLFLIPVLLLFINTVIVLSGNHPAWHLYTFGAMVLIAEVLRSALQEPVFFILFQPLKPHTRLKGHLITKGYTLPVALLGTGLFLDYYLQHNEYIALNFMAQLLVFWLVLWAASVFLIKKEYLKTLKTVLQKGYFTGSTFFLNDQSVIDLLIQKTESTNPQEVIHALFLLEKSGYQGMQPLTMAQLNHSSFLVRRYILGRIIAKKITTALPYIQEQLAHLPAAHELYPDFIKTLFYLDKDPHSKRAKLLNALEDNSKKAALTGLIIRKDAAAQDLVRQELQTLVASSVLASRQMAAEVLLQAGAGEYTPFLTQLLQDSEPAVRKTAIEATGKVRNFALLPLLVQTAVTHQSYGALQKALVHYGDKIYSPPFIPAQTLTDQSLRTVIKMAGKIKGKHSELYLLRLLKQNSVYADLAVEALWVKQTKLSPTVRSLLESWLTRKIEQSKRKGVYFRNTVDKPAATLLQDALLSEIKQDLAILLKGFFLIYDRPQIERVMALYKFGDPVKVSNATEMLELLIPPKYFGPLNGLIELTQDVTHHRTAHLKANSHEVKTIITEILDGNPAHCNSWTRAVACYIIPQLPGHLFKNTPLLPAGPSDDFLLRETKEHILSIL